MRKTLALRRPAALDGLEAVLLIGGVYVSAALTLGSRKLPVSISTLLNEPIQSSIAGGQEFIWNVSVTYSWR